MAATLETLPPEILRNILELLRDCHPRSVLTFACASKYCHSAAAPFLYHTIIPRPSKYEDLNEAVEQELCRLERHASFKYVHKIIMGPIAYGRRTHWTDSGFVDPLMDRSCLYVPYCFKPNPTWDSVASLIKKTPNLKDLVFDFAAQFPPLLLETLHRYQPQCRLHLSQFRILSMTNSIADPYEFRVITSPCLYSICTNERYLALDQDSTDSGPNEITTQLRRRRNYQQAIMRMIAGLSPNLQEVHYHVCGRMNRRGSPAPPWDLWSGFTQDKDRNKVSVGSLRHLKLDDSSGLSVDMIEQWWRRVDFSKLEVLRIENLVSQDTIDYMVTNCDFPSLKTLVLMIAARGHLSKRQDEGRNLRMAEFIQRLPPLTTMRLIGWHPNVSLSSLLYRHGSHLRTLHIPICPGPKMTKGDIEQIASTCPALEDLYLTIPRSRGDASEVALYRALGFLPNLRHLQLELDASHHPSLTPTLYHDQSRLYRPVESSIDPSFDDYDLQHCDRTSGAGSVLPRGFPPPVIRHGHIRDAFINSAVDGDLACAIFQVVSSTKPTTSCPLETLGVRSARGNPAFLDHMIAREEWVYERWSVPWKVERSVRDDCRDQLLVAPLDGSRSPCEECMLKNVEIFRRIWPQKGENSKWWEDWHSFPLDLGQPSSEG